MLSKKILSLLTALTLCISSNPFIYGANLAEIYKDEITIGVGETVNVSMTYGNNSSTAQVILSSLNVDAYLEGTTLNIKGLSEGISYVTLLFNDGSRDSIRVVVDDDAQAINDNNIEIERNKSKSIFIDLDKYNSKSVRISYDSSNVSVNKSYFSSDGELKITGKTIGESVLRVEYSTGEVERYYINVVNHSVTDDSIRVYLNDYENYYIDLEDYGAKKATVYYDSDYVSVNKTSFTSSGNLRITGKEIGVSSIRIRFDTGENLYISVDVDREFEGSREYATVYKLDENETAKYYVDLGYYNSDFATISYNSRYISVNRDRITNSGYLEITGEYRGTVDVRIQYESGKIEYLQIIVENGSYAEDPYLSVDEINVVEGEREYITVNLGDTQYVNIRSSSSSIATVSSSYLSSDSRIYITGKKEGKTNITFTFQGGEKITVPVTVIDKDDANPKVTIDDEIINVGEETEIKISMGRFNSSVQMFVENPLKFDVDIEGYNVGEDTYKIESSPNSEVTFNIKGISPCKSTDIIFYFADGQTCKVTLTVLKDDMNETDGYTSKGSHFVLRSGISANKTVLNEGYIYGYTDGSFGPERLITREEFGVMLSRILNTDTSIKVTDYISDVTSTWSRDGIAKLVAMGIVDKSERYRPTDYITRYEVAEMLYNALDLTDFSTKSSLTDLQGTDALTIKMAQCNNAGIIAGYPNKTFGGNDNITRAQAVVMLNRVFYENNNTIKVSNFNDLEESHWAYEYILKAANK